MRFSERVVEMGLQDLGNGNFYYQDQYAEVLYRELYTKQPRNDYDDIFEVRAPIISLFTKVPSADEYRYCGSVSDRYRFAGHDTMNEPIRTSILETGNPILREQPYFSFGRVRMHNEIIIQHETTVPRVGIVYPQMTVKNTYDGTGQQEVSFGLALNASNSDRYLGFSFRQKLGSMKQVHLENAQTRLQAEIGGYVTTFPDNIVRLIEINFDNRIEETEMLSTLEVIEVIGKKRREKISSILQEISGAQDEESMTQSGITSWQLFLAITRYSAIEGNLNARTLLEDVAERVLVVPDRMIRVVEEINQQLANAA